MAHTLRCSANHATFLRAYLIERNLTVSRPVGFLLHGYQMLMYFWYLRKIVSRGQNKDKSYIS